MEKRRELGEYKEDSSKEDWVQKLEEWNLRRKKLLEKYMAKILYGWDDKKFKKEY